MIYLPKSQPAPICLAEEKKKASGNYNCGDVLKIKGIGGLLIGGASLVYEEFIQIMKSVKI